MEFRRDITENEKMDNAYTLLLAQQERYPDEFIFTNPELYEMAREILNRLGAPVWTTVRDAAGPWISLVKQCISFDGTMMKPNIYCDAEWLESKEIEKRAPLFECLDRLYESNSITREEGNILFAFFTQLGAIIKLRDRMYGIPPRS